MRLDSRRKWVAAITAAASAEVALIHLGRTYGSTPKERARWVDRLLFPANGRSADFVVPELQDVHVGTFIPDGRPKPSAVDLFRVSGCGRSVWFAGPGSG